MKKILIILSIIVAICSGIGLYLWNKAPDKVEDRPSSAINATVLAKAFMDNEQQANETYLNKVLDVTGTVAEISQNQDGKSVLILSNPSDPMGGVQCTMRSNNIEANVGESITVKGFCNGYTLVVLLSDCIVK